MNAILYKIGTENIFTIACAIVKKKKTTRFKFLQINFNFVNHFLMCKNIVQEPQKPFLNPLNNCSFRILKRTVLFFLRIN